MLGWRGTSDAVHMSVMEDQHQRGAQLVRITLALTPSLIHRLDERRKHDSRRSDRHRGGLVFIAASRDDKLRAFDVSTGKELWQASLPAGGQQRR